MKAFLLLCFFLLFYSINSLTNNQKKCEYSRERCYNSCMEVRTIHRKDCYLGCKRNYYKCLSFNGN